MKLKTKIEVEFTIPKSEHGYNSSIDVEYVDNSGLPYKEIDLAQYRSGIGTRHLTMDIDQIKNLLKGLLQHDPNMLGDLTELVPDVSTTIKNQKTSIQE